MLDRERLTKLLAMTTSDNDGEALNALRMANKMLATEKLSWDQVLMEGPQRTVTVTVNRDPGFARRNPYTAEPAEGDWIPPHLKDKVIIDLMFRAIYAQPRSNEEFFQWVDSVHNRWQKFGNITQAQYVGLQKSYNRVKRA